MYSTNNEGKSVVAERLIRTLSSFHLCLPLQIILSNLHMHLQVLYHSICLVLLVLHIRLNTLTFKSFITSGTQILAYGPLILLQLPLHLFILTLKG